MQTAAQCAMATGQTWLHGLSRYLTALLVTQVEGKREAEAAATEQPAAKRQDLLPASAAKEVAVQNGSIARAQAIADRLAEMAASSAEQPERSGNANSYPPASSTAAGVPTAPVHTSVAIPGISVQAPPQQLSAGHQQPTGSIVTEARQRRRASKFDQPAGEPRAADYPSLLPPPPLHSSNAQKPLTQVAAPVQGVSAQASLPLPGPPPAHSVSASESAESMRARAQAVAARFAAAAAAEEGSQAAEAAMPATAQRPAGLQQPAAAASEFEDDADPFKSLPPLPAKSTPLPRPPRPDPAGLSFNSSKADTIPPAAATTAAPSAVPLKPPPHLSGGMWPRPPQPPGGMPHGPPPRPISGPRPPPGPYPAHPPPQHYPSHLQVRQAGCGLSQCLCSDYYFLFFEFSGGPV